VKGNLEMLTEIDQIVRQEIDLQGPGVAIAVVKEGKPVHIEGYGVANLEWDCPIRPDTVFRLASITKQFTATAIMLLEHQGKLRLDDSITIYLPDYPTHDRTITITHLLNHTSGIKSYTSLDIFVTDIAKKDMSPADLLAYFKNLPLEFEPGTRFLYNNSGYHLLGLLIEKLAEMSYEQFIQQFIFQPLGMNHSY
jgi:CubicO group peptidase (beta-lactamase class C family)